MKLNHINNIVLYEKNWYKHTDDYVADIKKYIAMDHPEQADAIATFSNEELYNLMRSDYVEWLDSIDPSVDVVAACNIDYLKNGIDDCVGWEDDPYLKVIYHWLTSYQIYIPDLFSGLQPPVYDKERDIMPQRHLRLVDPFSSLTSEATDEELTKAAARYFAQTKLEVTKTSFLMALKDFNINKVVDVLCDFNIKYRNDKRRTYRWIEKSCYGLWNRIKKYVKENPDGEYKLIRNGFMAAAVWPRKMNVDLMFIPIYESADISEVDVPEDASVIDKQKALLNKCVDKINRKTFERILVLERGADGFHNFGEKYVTVSEWVDDLYDTLRTDFFDREYVGTCGTGGIYVVFHAQPTEMNIYYQCVVGFGIHESTLHNANNWATGSKD